MARKVNNLSAMQKTQVWSLGKKIPWRRELLLTPVFLPGKFHEQRSLAVYSPWGRKESDRTEGQTLSLSPYTNSQHFNILRTYYIKGCYSSIHCKIWLDNLHATSFVYFVLYSSWKLPQFQVWSKTTFAFVVLFDIWLGFLFDIYLTLISNGQLLVLFPLSSFIVFLQE